MKRYPNPMHPADRGRLRPSLPRTVRDQSAPPRISPPPTTDPSFGTCLFCRDPILVQEPIIVVEHDRERKTSLAREPELAGRARGLLLHTRCAPPGWQSSD